MYFDTHAHYDWAEFNETRDLLFNSLNNYKILNIGIDLESCKKSISYSKNYSNIYNSIGIHPMNAIELKIFDNLEKLITDKTIAIGETGIDYKFDNIGLQRNLFLKHIKLAQKYKLPLIIHCRKAHEELYKILSKEKLYGCVMHCYSGNETDAIKFLNLNCYFGFDGPITRSDKFDKIIELIPMDKILVETDAPLMPSFPYDDNSISDSTQLYFIIEKISKIKNIDIVSVTKIIYNNSIKFFNIDL